MRKRFLKPGAVEFVVVAVAAACGGTTTSGGQSDGPPDNPAVPGGSGGSSAGADCVRGTERCACFEDGTCNAGLVCASELCVDPTGAGGTVPVIEGLGGRPHFATGGSGGGCTPVAVSAELAPLNLIFILDWSSSADETEDAAATRWIPVRDGFLAFSSESGSSWTYASLELFPAAGDLVVVCDVTNYERPAVPLLRLDGLDPATSPFSLALHSTSPVGVEPTLPALLGTLNYARDVQSDYPGSTTVVVLVTTGLPGFWYPLEAEYGPGCTEPLENTVQNVAAVAAEGLADGVLAHVIGVGDASELSALHEVALAGGTDSAAIVETGDAAATAAQLQAELVAIRTQHLPCTFELPDFEDGPGVLIDFDEIAVVVTVDGIPIAFPQSPGCQTEEGYQFRFTSDNSDIPSHVELCPAACQSVHSTADVEIVVEFPCGVLPY